MKLGNRKKRRSGYLLDVKVQTRGRSLRRIRAATVSVVGLSLIVLTGYGIRWCVKAMVRRLVYENPRFAIRRIVVDDNGVLTPVRVMQFASVQIGQNLLSVDLDQVRHNLEMLPLVRSVEVRRMLPDRLFIRVAERTAVARLRAASRELGDETFYIDRAGYVMKALKLADGLAVAELADAADSGRLAQSVVSPLEGETDRPKAGREGGTARSAAKGTPLPGVPASIWSER